MVSEKTIKHVITSRHRVSALLNALHERIIVEELINVEVIPFSERKKMQQQLERIIAFYVRHSGKGKSYVVVIKPKNKILQFFDKTLSKIRGK